MKVLVIGGMHGNEPLGIELVRRLNARPVKNVDAVLANLPAINANRRFTDEDLNRSFPGDTASASYVLRRAAELIKLSQSYDIVLDFHNTHCPGNDCSFIGAGTQSRLFDVSSWCGLKRVIVADYNCINKYASNCVSIEISLNSPQNYVEFWYEKVSKLAELENIRLQPPVETFRFVYRMTLEDKRRFDLEKYNLKAFQPLPLGLAEKLKVASPAYPIFIGDAYTPYNYGGLLNKL